MAAPAGRPERFFVTIYAPSTDKVRALQSYGVDVFGPTARELPDGRAVISGLLNLEQTARLVADGYQVLVEEEASKRLHGPRDVIEFDEWYARRKARK